jgi:hypothetical protein
MTDHGKLMHLFLLRDGEFDAFAHLHPLRRDARTFENVLPPLPAGRYWIYADVTHENGSGADAGGQRGPAGSSWGGAAAPGGTNEAFCAPVIGPPNSAQTRGLDADDSWHLGGSATPGECRLMAVTCALPHRRTAAHRRGCSLRFALFGPDGQPAALDPYLG